MLLRSTAMLSLPAAMLLRSAVMLSLPAAMRIAGAADGRKKARHRCGAGLLCRRSVRRAGSVDHHRREVLAQQRSGAVELLGGILAYVAESVLEPHRLVLVDAERVVGEQLDPLQRAVAAKLPAQCADILLGVAVARYEHIAQPEGLAVLLEPGGRAQRLGIVAPGEQAVALRVGLLDVEQHQVGEREELLDVGIPERAVGVDAGVDALLAEHAQQRHERPGLEGGLASREGHAAPPAEEGALVDGHAENLFGRRRLPAAGLNRVGVGAVEAAEVAALEKDDQPQPGAVEGSHRFVGVYAKHRRVVLCAGARFGTKPGASAAEAPGRSRCRMATSARGSCG